LNLLFSPFFTLCLLKIHQIEIFQEYNDTVIAVGLSHLPRNSKIFSASDLAIGVDVLSDCITITDKDALHYNALLPSEVHFASAISAHFCAFRLRGVASIEHMPTILAQGRASLAAAISASIFLFCGYLSFSFYVFFTVCSVSTTVPYIPISGAVLYLLFILPLVGLPMAMTDPDKGCMEQVPPKNDASVSFGKREGKTFYLVSFLRAVPPAVFPQILYLIALGEFMIEFESGLLQSKCSPNLQPGDWVSVIRCEALNDYSGIARDSAVALSLAELILCTLVASTSFVYRTISIWEEPPWRRNHIWAVSVFVGVIVVIVYLLMTLETGSYSSLPWYFYFLAVLMPLLCSLWDEALKRPEKNVLDRAEKLRRLQFETRLGMWSPK
jgi:magnesium-transporting ATPase (P-type)